MLKALGWLIKLSLLSIAVLIAGEWVHWDGRTLSQHVRWQIDHVGRSGTATYLRELTRQITDDARGGFDHKNNQSKPLRSHGSVTAATQQKSDPESADLVDHTEIQAAAPRTTPSGDVRTASRSAEQIAPSERQKLRALIRELNSSHD